MLKNFWKNIKSWFHVEIDIRFEEAHPGTPEYETATHEMVYWGEDMKERSQRRFNVKS